MKKLTLSTVLLAFLLMSCQSLDSYIQDPRVSFNSVNIASISLTGATIVALVDVENPNSFPIPMPNIEWELIVNNTSFTNGILENNEGITIRSRENTTLNISVNVGYDRLFRTISSLIGTREAAYTLVLGLRFPTPLLQHRVFPLSYSGALPLGPR